MVISLLLNLVKHKLFSRKSNENCYCFYEIMTISYYIKELYIYISVMLLFGLTWYEFYPQTNYNSPGLSKKRVDT